MYMNAGNAENSVSTAFTRLDSVRICLLPNEYTVLTHFALDPGPPIFFMNAITSDSFKLPLVPNPTVSCMLPYTCAVERDTKSLSAPETAAASSRIFESNCCALDEALAKSLRKSRI